MEAQKVYNWSWKNDGLTLGLSTVAWIGSEALKESAEPALLEDIMELDRNKVWAFDRGATDNNSEYARGLSNTTLFGSMAVPFFTIASQRSEGNQLAIIGMALETYLITDAVTNVLKATTKRYRPFNYNPQITLEEKLTPTSRQSFASGHTSMCAAACFLSARIITDLHPDSKLKPLVWTLAAVIPAFTGYLRYEGGRHFPTDIIAGYGIGATVGYLIPQIHHVDNRDVDLGINMIPGGAVLGLTLTF